MGKASYPDECFEITPELVAIVKKAVDVAIEYQKAVGGKRKLGITGEVGEVLVCRQRNLRMMRGDRSEGYDAIDSGGQKVQIKTRRSEVEGLPNDVGTLSAFSKHEFDYALMAILDHGYRLCEIWRADYEDLAPVIESKTRRNPTLRAFKKVGSRVYSSDGS